MHRSPWLPALCVLATLPAMARAEVSEFLYVCDAPTSQVTLRLVDGETATALKEARARGREAERIDVSPLIHRTSQTSPDGSRLRGTSDQWVRQCGTFTLTITGGYLNVNPDGAEGIYELPVIGISHQSGKRFARFTLGRCDASFRRFSRTTDCPMAWATEVRADLMDGKPYLALEHQFSDTQGLDDAP